VQNWTGAIAEMLRRLYEWPRIQRVQDSRCANVQVNPLTAHF
jgi:hypothetical protein